MYSHLNEPNILKRINKYDLGTKLISSFKDYDNIYLITTLFEGKTLDYFKNNILNEEQIKFISACIIQSFVYFRKENIIHRDIGFENIIMDSDKYFNIIDFSCSVDNNDLKYNIITDVRLLSPERLKKKKYNFNSDYYGLGSLLYYLIFKAYPNVIKEKNKLLSLSINYNSNLNFSPKCIDFINKLIVENPIKRIGYKDVNELKNHSWFKMFDWNKLEKKLIESPFNFINGSFNNISCSKYIKSDLMINIYKKNSKIFKFKEMLKNYDFININIIKNKK